MNVGQLRLSRLPRTTIGFAIVRFDTSSTIYPILCEQWTRHASC
jgi:hypothetical protein